MIKMALIDSDEKQLKNLILIGKNFFDKRGYKYRIDCFCSPLDFIYENMNYDIVFLEIDLPDMNGIDLANYIRSNDKNCCICFITILLNYALNSYKVHAFDFIKKPYSESRIIKALSDFMIYYKDVLIQKTELSFKVYREDIVTLSLMDIFYFEYFDKSQEFFNRSTVLYTKTSKYGIKEKISELYNTLPEGLFCQPHRSFIINLINISHISDESIIMKNGVIIPLAQKRVQKIKYEYKLYANNYHE